MAGRGFLAEAVPVDNTNVYVLRNGRFHHLFRPVHNDRSFAGVCLAECPLSDALKNYPFINEALRRVAAEQPRTGFVSAQGLGANSDNLHFNAKALHEFGLRYFEEFRQLMGEEIVSKSDTDATEPIRTEMELL